MKLSIVAALCVLILYGCDAVDSMREGFEHAQAVSAELEKSVGVKPFIAFKWHNGSLVSVNITFKTLPDKSVAEIGAVSRTAILKHFKQEPKEIVLAFTITP